METKVDISQALRVFDKIQEHGSPNDHGKQINGISIDSNYNDYTVMLYTDSVHLSIFFHNSFTFKYSDSDELKHFMEELDNIDKEVYH